MRIKADHSPQEATMPYRAKPIAPHMHPDSIDAIRGQSLPLPVCALLTGAKAYRSPKADLVP